MKGRRVPVRPVIQAVVDKPSPLTLEDIRLVIERSSQPGVVTMRTGPIVIERMPETPPYERGVLDRFQDRKRKGSA